MYSDGDGMPLTGVVDMNVLKVNDVHIEELRSASSISMRTRLDGAVQIQIQI